MATIHITEAEAVRNLPALLAEVRAGTEVVIENGALPAAILRSGIPAGSTISDCIALARKHEQESGEAPILDRDFADDVAEILRDRKPWSPIGWR